MDERLLLEIEAMELAMTSPRFLRQIIMLAEGICLDDQIQPWQIRDFEALDSAWQQVAGLPADRRTGNGRRMIRRAYIERPRGHSKTSDMAMQIAWILLAARAPVTGVAAAADQEQASLLLKALHHLRHVNPVICRDLSFVEGAVRNSRTGSRLDLISSDVGSSYGILPDFVICDELSHWPGPELWYSLLSSAAKKPNCVLAVLTNAGAGRGWAWDVRQNASQSADWYFSSLNGPHAPWITEQNLAEQQAMLPTPVFERLWLNRWQHSDGEFVTLAEAEGCIDANLTRVEEGQGGIRYIAAIDYAEKHDFTVAVVCHREGGRIIVDRMDVVRPSPLRPTPTVWVEQWIEQCAGRFPSITFVVDEYQLVSICQKLGDVYPIERFEFRAGQGNHALAMNLRQLITQRSIAWYPGCGAYPEVSNALWQDVCPQENSQGRDDLATELSSLLLRQNPSGRIRIDHRSGGRFHDDRAFALGVACLQLVNPSEETAGQLHITSPDGEGGFAWGDL